MQGTESLRSALLRHEDLGVSTAAQVYLGDPIPTVLMKVHADETLDNAIERFKAMYPTNPSGRSFEVFPDSRGDFGHVTIHTFDRPAASPNEYILHDLYVEGRKLGGVPAAGHPAPGPGREVGANLARMRGMLARV